MCLENGIYAIYIANRGLMPCMTEKHLAHFRGRGGFLPHELYSSPEFPRADTSSVGASLTWVYRLSEVDSDALSYTDITVLALLILCKPQPL